MDGTAIRSYDMELDGSDLANRKIRSVRICVEGYDTRLPEDEVKSALRKHFASCGEIVDVYFPGYVGRKILNRFAYVYLMGEGAEEKALKLSGTDVGGWTVIAKPIPFRKEFLNNDQSPPVISPKFYPQRTLVVSGYDTSLPRDVVESAICKHLSSCGDSVSASIPDPCGALLSKGMVFIKGQGAAEKALKLGGCNVGAVKFVVERVLPLKTTGRGCGGYTLRSAWSDKKAKTTEKSRMTTE